MSSRILSLQLRSVVHPRRSSRFHPWMAVSLPFVAAGALHISDRSSIAATRRPYHSSQAEGRKDSSTDDSGATFDISKHWENAKDYFDKAILTDKPSQSEPTTPPKTAENISLMGIFNKLKSSAKDFTTPDSNKNRVDVEQSQNLQDVQTTLMGMLTGRQPTVEDLIAKARTSSEQGDVSDSVSLQEVLTILKTAGNEFEATVHKHLEGRDLPTLSLTSLYYFLEYEDERKNFSYRRRKHRFCPGINTDSVEELYEYMRLAEIGYEDEIENIKQELQDTFGYELVYCQMDSLPGQPSHFIAIRKDQSKWSPSLDMLLCVRGTATITDIITDLLADAVDYKGGKAHSGICQSGKYLVEKHLETFESFLEASGKSNINLTLVGHSLGAGAASIAGMELHDDPRFNVQVVGFGCPALVSQDLSEKAASYITTIVSDNDCVPRMSLPSMINAILDIGEYNWIPRARQDLEDVVDQVQYSLPDLITDSTKESLLQLIHSRVLSTLEIPEPTTDRLDPILFPRTYRVSLVFRYAWMIVLTC